MKAAILTTQKMKHFYKESLLILSGLLLFASNTFAQYKNTATATASAAGSVQVSDISNNGNTLNQPSGDQTPINFPMVGLGKIASAPLIQNDGTYNVDYTFTVKNFGQVALQNVQVQDLLTTTFPSPVTYTLRAAITVSAVTLTANSSFDGTSANPNLLVAASSTLAIGESRTITVPLNINLHGAFGTFNNTATATAKTADNTAVYDVSNNSSNPDGNGDGNPFNDAAPTPVTISSPDIQVLITADNPAPAAGNNIIFTITAKNNGPGSAANVLVNDLLNSGYTFVSAATSAGTYNPATGVWSVGNLSSSASQTLTITAKVLYSKTAAEYQNTASSNYLGDNTPSNNSQTISVTPVQAPPVAVNDNSVGVAATASATLNIIANDRLADGTAATISKVTVDLDPSTSGTQTTLNVTGQGVWNYDNTSGSITFTPNTGFTVSPTAITYILTETATGLSAQATIPVIKAANTDVTLRSLGISTGTLSPGFTSSNPNYTVTVPYTVTSIGVNAAANDANATISINNATAAGGSVSNTVSSLNVGLNTIPVLVTAQDGVTRQTYTISVTREKAPQVITFASPATKTFGDADFPLSAASNNVNIPVTYMSDNPAVATVVNGSVHIVGTGTVNFTASQQGDGNYSAAADVIRTLVVNPAAQTISFTVPAMMVYGDADFTLSAAASSSGLPVTYSSSDASVASVNGTTVSIHQVGTFTLTAAQAGNANYNAAANVIQVVTVSPKTLAASLTGTISKVYDGSANASFSGTNYVLSAKVGTDDVTLNYPLTGNYNDKTVNSNKQVSITGLNLTGTKAYNYVLASTALTANIGTITPVNVTVNLTGTATKVYDGNTLATLSAANYQLSGVIGNDQVSFTKPVSGIYDNSSAGVNKLVTVNNISISGFDAGNYTLALAAVSGNVGVITTKTLTVKADNQTKVYGAALPAFSFTYDGFAAGETSANLAVLPAANSTATADSPAGTYPINVSGAAANNYDFNYVSGILTIGKSNQAVTFAALPAKVYGDADFSLSAAASSDLPVAFTSSNPAVASVDGSGTVHIISAGTTTITASQAGNNNYTGAAAVTQILVVNKVSLMIAADAQRKTYGAINPALTISYNGFVNGETKNVLAVQPTITTTATTTSAAGIYPVTVTGAAANNYTISYTPANFTVIKAALTITADNKSRFFGLANPALTVNFTGFVNGDTRSSLTIQPVVSTTATSNSPAGTYPVTANNAEAANYSITYVPGTLTVTNASVNSVSLAAVTLLENQPAGTLAGTFSTTSLDPNAAYTYSLISGTGSADNALFRISGNQLVTAQSLDYEQKPVYSVLIRATNQYGLYLDQSFVINLTDVNEAPTLAAIPAQQLCYTQATQRIRLINVTPGPETAQQVTLSVSSSNAGLFNNLSVSAASNGTATLSYQLATTGTTTITVTVKDNGGTANGGQDSFSQRFTLTANELPIAEISSDKGTQISKGETVTLTATGGGTYSWNPLPNVSGNGSSAVIRIRPEQTTTYQVSVGNNAGCSSVKSITIEVADDYSMIQPANILTPNGDGQNDTWVIKNIDLYPNNTVSIYDKGGRKLIEVKRYDNRWDGTLNGSLLTEGTYYYVIDFGEGKGPKKGFITILRNR